MLEDIFYLNQKFKNSHWYLVQILLYGSKCKGPVYVSTKAAMRPTISLL